MYNFINLFKEWKLKKSGFVVVFLLFGFISLSAQANRYDIKSAIIEYDIVGNGQVMGTKTTLSGKSTLYFKDFGATELTDEIVSQSVMGEIEEEHTILKIVNDKVYTVDFNDEVVYRQKMVLDETNPFMNIKNKDAFLSMGAKSIGQEKILGFLCDIWELGEDKIWVYNSVPLKFVSQSMDINQVQEAKKAVFNVQIEDSKFKLPSFPIKDVEDIINDSSIESIDLSPEQEKMIEEMMKQAGKTSAK